MKLLQTGVLSIFLILTGCSAMLVPATSNPDRKLDQAYQLFEYDGRTLPAESLIFEAIEICKNENNVKVLMKAYWTYGAFLRSKAVQNLDKWYEEKGFIDNTVTYESRNEKSIEYFNMAESIAVELNDLNYLGMLPFNKAMAYEATGQIELSCMEYRIGLERNEKDYNSDPDVKFFDPGIGLQGFEKHKKFVLDYMKSIGCK